MRGSARRRVSQGARRPFLDRTRSPTLLAATLGLAVSAPQARRGVSGQAHPSGRAVRRWRRGGHRGARRRPEDEPGAQAADHRRQPPPGASTNIGLDIVAKSPADGYTIMMASNSLATNSALFAKLSLQPRHRLRARGARGRGLAGRGGARQVEDRLAEDPRRPGQGPAGKLAYASAGNGSSGHLAGEMLKDTAGIDVLHVPYKGGAPAITDLLGERITFMPINPLEVITHIHAGTLRPLAVASAKRSALLPDVPTSREEGLPNFTASVWWGLVAPAKTPPAIIKQLNAAANTALADADVRKQLTQLGVTILPGTPEAFGQFVRTETTTWAGVIRKAGITAD